MNATSVVHPAIIIVAILGTASSFLAATERVKGKDCQIVGLIVLACYGAIYLRFMLFSRTYTTWKPLLLLEPFWSYRACLSIDWTGLHVTNHGLFDQIVVNYLLYFPLSCLLPFTWPRFFYLCGLRRGLFRIIMVALVCSLVTEVAQYEMRVGYLEIDDIFNNSLGAGIGYIFYSMCYVLMLRLFPRISTKV